MQEQQQVQELKPFTPEERIKQYLECRNMGVSHFMDFCNSPKHFHWNRILKRREETDAMREGTALHKLILEPGTFGEKYCTDLELPTDTTVLKTIDDIKQFLTNCGIAFKKTAKKPELMDIARETLVGFEKPAAILFDDWVDVNTRNKEYINKTQWDKLQYMAESIREHRFAQRYLQNAKTEVTLQIELFGWSFRGRLDWLVDDVNLPHVIVPDLKKTKSAQFHRFRSTVYENQYFVQAYLYSKMVEQHYERPSLYTWVAVEGSSPFITEVYSANDAMLDAGETLVKARVARLEECLKNNNWPGYSEGFVNNMDLPNYGYDQIAHIESEEENEH